MTKIYLDPGHGGGDPGATANGISEADIVLKIGLRTRRILLEQYRGVDVRMSRTTDVFKSLSWRADDANQWGADYFVSIHCNAGGGNGFESYRFNGIDGVTKLQREVHDAVYGKARSFGSWLTDRGKKSANFAVLRETVMQAVLTENLFVDHDSSADLLKRDEFITALARGHAAGIARAAGLEKKDGGRMSITDKIINKIRDRVWSATFKKLNRPKHDRISVKHALNWTLYRVDNIWRLLKEVNGKLDRLITAFREHDEKLGGRIDSAMADDSVEVAVQLPEERDPAEGEPDEGLAQK